ncbi:alpha/beta fold hydrolase [Nonomuraea thailandensis]
MIVPSLPGFAFSPQRPTLAGAEQTHDLWHLLMHDELGFRRYAAHGGDLGAGVTSRLAEAHPEAVVGIHLLAAAAPAGYDPAGLTPEEETYLASLADWQAEEGGYMHQQNTRPLTLAAGLADSPAGLLAWMVEKYRAWSDSGGTCRRASATTSCSPRPPSTGSRARSPPRSGPTTSTRTA